MHVLSVGISLFMGCFWAGATALFFPILAPIVFLAAFVVTFLACGLCAVSSGTFEIEEYQY